MTGRRWLTPILLAPQLAAIALVLSIPQVQLWATQRTAPWRLLFSVEPIAVIWLIVLGVGAAAVLMARTVAVLLGAFGGRRCRGLNPTDSSGRGHG